MEDIAFLEKVLLDSILPVSSKTSELFGKAKPLVKKVDVGSSIGEEALTEMDLENQEVILQYLYRHAPWVGISVEERVNHPTPVQEKLYANQDASLLVQLDPIDGTHAYRDGIRKDYGIIASVLERVSYDLGMFRLGIMHYPSLGYTFVADNLGLYYVKKGQKVKIERDPKKAPQGKYFTTTSKKLDRVGIMNVERGIYSITQMLLQLVSYEIPGFLTLNGHTNDHTVGAWMAQQWGADVEYASGAELRYVPFGDTIIDGKRVPPRDEHGLLIIGKKGDGFFEDYQKKCRTI